MPTRGNRPPGRQGEYVGSSAALPRRADQRAAFPTSRWCTTTQARTRDSGDHDRQVKRVQGTQQVVPRGHQEDTLIEAHRF